MKRFSVFLAVLVVFFCMCKKSKEPIDPPLTDAVLQAEVLTQNLTHPWELVWGSDQKLWMTERGGNISRVDPVSGAVSLVADLSEVVPTGEGGLLGMALHPNFNTTPEVFIVYNYNKSGTYTEKVVKYTYNGTTLVSPVVLLDNIPAAGIHNGSRLVISSDNKLFITTGDASVQSSAQNSSSLSGKIHRINLDGTIPADNPSSASSVWSSGHRNPQGLVFVHGKLYSSEHGPDVDDEINIIEKARNYGWPNVKGLCNDINEQSFCLTGNIAEPIYTWTPTIAVCGMDFYNHDAIPQWKNSLILATLKDETLYQLKLNVAGDEIDEVKTFYRSDYGRLRDVCIAPDGKVYLVTSNGSNDKIIKISRTN